MSIVIITYYNFRMEEQGEEIDFIGKECPMFVGEE